MIVTADDPAGPWSKPVGVPLVGGIDPDLTWDDQGRCWCTYAGIHQVPLDPTTGQVSGPAARLWSGTPGAHAPEAPHLYQLDGYWYLLIAEGGAERGHGVSIARGPAPDGPFEPGPANPILSHRSTPRPIQNTGHADLVQAPDGCTGANACWPTKITAAARNAHTSPPHGDDPTPAATTSGTSPTTTLVAPMKATGSKPISRLTASKAATSPRPATGMRRAIINLGAPASSHQRDSRLGRISVTVILSPDFRIVWPMPAALGPPPAIAPAVTVR